MTEIPPYGEMDLRNMHPDELHAFSEKLWLEGNGPGWEIVKEEWLRRERPDVPERIERRPSSLKRGD
jgi:hypothetical protein